MSVGPEKTPPDAPWTSQEFPTALLVIDQYHYDSNNCEVISGIMDFIQR